VQGVEKYNGSGRLGVNNIVSWRVCARRFLTSFEMTAWRFGSHLVRSDSLEIQVVVAFSFFVSVFLTIVWLIFSVTHISDGLGGMSFDSLSIHDASIQMLVVVIPIFIIWMIFGYVLQFMQARSISGNMVSLFKQMKKNQDYTDLIGRIMLEAEREVKDSFMLNRFDLFISDMNELAAEVIYRANIASNEQIERLWKKVQNGGKWAFGKVIVEVNCSQPNFQVRLFEKSKADAVLAGTILEFCARYNSLIALLEKHDKNRIFLDIIETGVFGKTFTIMSPIAEEIRHVRESSLSLSKKAGDFEADHDDEVRVVKQKKIYNPEASSEDKPSIVSKLNIFKKKDEAEPLRVKEDKMFSAALERSFGEAGDGIQVSGDREGIPGFLSGAREEPLFDDEGSEVFAEDRRVEVVVEPRAEARREEPKIEAPATNTQRALDSLKKEWEEMKHNDDQPSYPFGGWADEENYK